MSKFIEQYQKLIYALQMKQHQLVYLDVLHKIHVVIIVDNLACDQIAFVNIVLLNFQIADYKYHQVNGEDHP